MNAITKHMDLQSNGAVERFNLTMGNKLYDTAFRYLFTIPFSRFNSF